MCLSRNSEIRLREKVFFVVIGDCVKCIVNAHDRDEVDFSIS